MKTRVKEFRARYDLTQEDLARKVGVAGRPVALVTGRNIERRTLARILGA